VDAVPLDDEDLDDEVDPRRGLLVRYTVAGPAGELSYGGYTVWEYARAGTADLVLCLTDGQCPALPPFPAEHRKGVLTLGLRRVPEAFWRMARSADGVGPYRILPRDVERYAANALWLEW